VLRRALQAQLPKAANVINWADPKYARIEINSLAAQELRQAADDLVGLTINWTRPPPPALKGSTAASPFSFRG
jgi:hypothetical protein